MVPYPIIFKGDEIYAFYAGELKGWVPSIELVPGDYVLVDYYTGLVGAAAIGVKEIVVKSIRVKKPLRLNDNLTHLDEMGTGEVELSAKQRQQVVTHIKREYHYWWDNALPIIKSILGEEVSLKDKARWSYIQATSLYKSGQPLDALRLIEEALKLDPELGGARFTLGEIALEKGDVQAAIAHFQKELELAAEPDDYNAHSYLSVIYEAQGRHTDAEVHSALAKQTEAYRNHPMYLAPKVVQRIRGSVLGKPVSEKPKRKGWQFWKR